MKNCKFCHSGNIIRTEYDFHDAYKCSACDKAFFEKIAECCRNPVDRYVDDFHNNVPVFIRVQCDNCGGCLNMTKSLKKIKINLFRSNFREVYFLIKIQNHKIWGA